MKNSKGSRWALLALANARHNALAPKYIRPDGTNEGMYRNNALDILEELADCVNIGGLLLDRLVARGISRELEDTLAAAHQSVIMAGILVLEAAEMLPPDMFREEVERVTPWETVRGWADGN